jgi:oligopeptide/dipeptide ABC transporter ATP-binding protein
LDKLNTIPGLVPSLYNLPKGCRFADRCKYVEDKCRQAYPALVAGKNPNQWVACIKPLGGL